MSGSEKSGLLNSRRGIERGYRNKKIGSIANHAFSWPWSFESCPGLNQKSEGHEKGLYVY